jgi:hypothetical protein
MSPAFQGDLMIRHVTTAVACSILFYGAAAQAASQSSASISGLTFTLIDLDPNDGITPSFTFSNSLGSTVATFSANDNALGQNDSASRTRPGTFSFSFNALTDMTNAGAKVALDNSSLSVGGFANGPQTNYSASASTGANPSSYYYNAPLNLSVSANSVLLIDADVDLAASASNPQACSYSYCSTTETATASATANLSYTYTGSSISSNYSGPQTLSLTANATGEYTNSFYQYDPTLGYYTWVYLTTPKTEEAKNLNDVLHSVFSNSTNLTQSGTYTISVAANGSATTASLDPMPIMTEFMTAAAVPEPSTYLLFAQGLGIGAFMLRRRRQA